MHILKGTKRMNKEHEIPNITAWCHEFQEKNGIKVHPANVPLAFIVEELLAVVDKQQKYLLEIHSIIEGFSTIVKNQESRIEAIIQGQDAFFQSMSICMKHINEKLEEDKKDE